MSKDYVMQLEATIENLRRDNALLKEMKNEQEKVLEIIFEKKVDIEYLSRCNDVKEYNAHWCDERFYLTQKEFNLVKEWSDWIKN